MPTNDMQQKGNKLVTVEGIEFICEDPPFSKNKPKSFTVNRNWTNESTIGRKLFGSTFNTIDFHHAKLKFDWTQVYITDLGSKYGTWTSSSGKLSAGKSVLLKDGSTIVFGADHDKTHQTPDAIRVKVKFLKTLKILQPVGKTTPNKPLDSLEVPAPAHPAGRSKTPETLKPPEDPHKHRRTVSLEAPKKDKPPLEHQKLVWRPGASTELQREIKVPWSETFRLGFGVDALTGESMTRTALTPFKVSGSPRPKQSKTYVNTLHWNDIKSLRDQYDMEIGGTINVAHTSVSMSTRISSFLSKNASASTVLIQYKVIGEFEPEFIPADAGLQHGLPQLSEDEFRERYGDYYLAGRQRGYGCRMVIVCRVNDKSKTDKVEVEAQTLVENFFKTGAAHSSAKSRSKNCSILHVMLETYGCSADASYLSSGLLSPQDALAALSNILTDPKGTPRYGILYHYSSLDRCKLPRTVTVQSDVFSKIHELRDAYQDLQMYLKHPALQTEHYTWDVNAVRSAIRAFENKRKNLVRNLILEPRPKRLQDTELYTQVLDAKIKAETLIRRHEFIAGVKGMSRKVSRSSNLGTKGSLMFSWECGKVGGRLKKKWRNYSEVTFGPGYDANEVEWETPLVNPLNPVVKKLFQPEHPDQMNFILIDPDEVNGKKCRRLGAGEDKFFNYRLSGYKVYVIGWTLSCTWDGKAEPGPVIQLDDGDNNFILGDRFSVRLDTSRRTSWHCRVTYVLQSRNQFPDLNLEERNFAEPSLDVDI